jgi:hypothetical protein
MAWEAREADLAAEAEERLADFFMDENISGKTINKAARRPEWQERKKSKRKKGESRKS